MSTLSPETFRPAQDDGRDVLELDIQGMTCASCVRRVEKKLNALDGVEASVNLPLHSAKVRTAGGVSTEEILATVAKAGYSASLAPDDDDALPGADSPREGRAAHDGLDLRPRLAVAGSLTILIVAFSMIPALALPGTAWLVAALTTPVVTWAAWPFHRSAVVNARHGGATMDTLVSLGVTVAYLSSLVSLAFSGAGLDAAISHGGEHTAHGPAVPPLYFETAAVIVTFLLLGRHLEHRATAEASEALRALVAASPKTALLVSREGLPLEEPAEVPAKSLRVGDVVRVRAGSMIPADGLVSSGTLSIDTSSMTGESVPRGAAPGEPVHAGTVVLEGSAEVTATAVGRQTRLSTIGRMVSDAQSQKARIARLADRISGVFVPIVLVIALLTLAGWWVATGSFSAAVPPAVAVLVIACPCALGLATPVGLVAGTGRASELGIYISSPRALEQAGRVGAVLFDKTGTLTTGRMRVASHTLFPSADTEDDDALRLAALLESRSSHPIAAAVVEAFPGTGEAAEESVADVASLPDGGLRGRVNGRDVVVGSPRALRTAGLGVTESAWMAEARERGESLALVAVDGELRAGIGIGDSPREDAAETVARLQEQGLAVYMLTGDHSAAARTVAEKVGIPADHVRAELLPEDKLTAIEALKAEHGAVVMVGDGLNDAAALASADLGIALSSGTDAAQGAADMTILGERLGSVVTALALAKRTLGTIRTNLVWAFAYNVIGIPVAAAGLLNPMLAGGAMALSSVLVVANSLRLRRWKG